MESILQANPDFPTNWTAKTLPRPSSYPARHQHAPGSLLLACFLLLAMLPTCCPPQTWSLRRMGTSNTDRELTLRSEANPPELYSVEGTFIKKNRSLRSPA
eukprot:752297-Hanusia_phi.AAC.7